MLAVSGATFLCIALLLKMDEAKQIVNTARGWFGGAPA
jgi:hypothetical protein